MAQDYAKAIRRAVLPALKAWAPLIKIVPGASIYPSTVPATRTFPFIRYGLPILTPFRASGLDSSSIRVTISAFAKPKLNAAGATIATAEDVAYDIGSAIKDCLDGATIRLETGESARLTWLTTIPRQDSDETDAWATTVSFTAEIAG